MLVNNPDFNHGIVSNGEDNALCFQIKANHDAIGILIDGVFSRLDGNSAFEFIVQNNWKSILSNAFQGPKMFSLQETEARAIPCAMKEADEKGFFIIHIFSDAMRMINVVT